MHSINVTSKWTTASQKSFDKPILLWEALCDEIKTIISMSLTLNDRREMNCGPVYKLHKFCKYFFKYVILSLAHSIIAKSVKFVSKK